MTEAVLYELVCRIYAVFGRPVPPAGDLVVRAVADAVADVPDSAARHLLQRMSDRDDMPHNLGRALFAEWTEWKARNTPAPARRKCRACGGYGGWECFRRNPEPRGPRWHHLWLQCPACTPHEPSVRMPWPRECVEKGDLIMPNDYPAGVVGFRREHGITF